LRVQQLYINTLLLLYFLIFIIGCFFGSFLNVIVDRLPKGNSIIFPPSHCEHCRHRLGLNDLIPILSFVLLKGKCRYCRAVLSWYYPVIEVVTGALFVITIFIGIHLGYMSALIYLLAIISSLILVFFIDLKYGVIPFNVIGISSAIATFWYLFSGAEISSFLLSALGVFVCFLLLFLVTRGRGIGFGDVVFSFLMGYILGFPKIVLGVYIAFLTGAFFSLILIMLNKKKYKGGTIPFGPFLVSGTIISLFWGEDIIKTFLLYLHVY
jgi:leader peptidase (prepilin peptidase)/N-methyltransferase